MKVLLLCLMLAQTLAATPELAPGTVVTLAAAPDLVPVYGSAVLEHHELVFNVSLEPETEVRVLIVPPGKEAGPSASPYGRIGPTGDDIFVQFSGAAKAVSFRKWLAEYGVELVLPPPGNGK